MAHPRGGMRISVLVLGLAAAASPVQAIPAFARRYKVECHFCHDIYPKLNAVGQRFRERGFRLEREDEFDASRWARSVPLTGRAWGNHTFREEGDDVSLGLIKAISAGNLGRRFAYWVDDGLLVRQKRSPGDERVSHAKPDNLWLRYEVVPGGKLYARAGRIELDLPFTQTRSPHLFPYDTYFANTGFETDAIGFHQDGLEVGGELPRDARWSAAVVKGHNAEGAGALSGDTTAFDGDLFLRLAKRIRRARVGAFAYVGRNTLARPIGQDRLAVWDDHLLRLGADADVWIRRLNLYGLYMHGSNDNSIATAARPGGTGESLGFGGGFAQADYHIVDEVALTLRLNVVSRPPEGTSEPNRTYSSVFPGVQVWVLDGYVKLSFEYGFQNQRRPSFGAVQLDVAF